jgi:hypothetical protein
VRLVSLTGDVETGKIIARTAADNLKRVHLELGGKAPVLVFDDADPAAVAEGIKIAATGTPARTAPPPRASSPDRRSTTGCSRSSCPRSSRCTSGDPAEGDEIEMGP